MLRLGVGERGVSEIMAVAEHIASLCVAADALRLPVDIPEPAEPSGADAVRPVEAAELQGEAREAMEEIAAWTPENLGIAHVPLIWRSLAHLPRMFANTWRKDRLVMSAGRLDEQTKACISFAVAAARQSPYMIAYTTALLRKALSLEDGTLVELVASIMHYISFNTISHAMLIEPKQMEMRAAQFVEG